MTAEHIAKAIIGYQLVHKVTREEAVKAIHALLDRPNSGATNQK
jgi:hypothetical protein